MCDVNKLDASITVVWMRINFLVLYLEKWSNSGVDIQVCYGKVCTAVKHTCLQSSYLPAFELVSYEQALYT
jgi:hypothetical protein